MSRIVIDASVTLSWCFPDEQTHMSLKVLDQLKSGEQAIVPAFSHGLALEMLEILEIRLNQRVDRRELKHFVSAWYQAARYA